MTMPQKTAAVFGGTGFIGRYIVRELARAGYVVKVVSRVPERAFFLKPYGTVGQIVPMACNFNDPKSIETVIRGSDVVINCIGTLYERRRRDFTRLHVHIPDAIASACARLDVRRMIHISALGIDASKSK